MGARHSAIPSPNPPSTSCFNDVRAAGAAAGVDASVGAAGNMYDGLDVAELERLVALRGLSTASRRLDRTMLELLLRAYDAGVEDVTASGADGGAGHARFPSRDSAAPRVASQPSVLQVLQQLRDAPGHMGVDIGGSLVKLVLAMPRSVANIVELPETFGNTGRSHRPLELSMSVGGEPWVLTFVSGSTSWMELAVKDVEKRRHDRSQRASAHEAKLRALSVSRRSRSSRRSAPEEDEIGRTLSGWSDIGSSSYRPVRRVATAGGGACKYAPLFREALRLQIQPVKELAAVVDGLLLLAAQSRTTEGNLRAFVGENGDAPCADLFTVVEEGSSMPLPWPDPLFPLLIVNMGSGVSILRVNSAETGDYVRVGGTACGGATFLGLARALTSAKTFEEALALAEVGDASRADKLVRDIYGDEGSRTLGLPSALTAANFGRLSEPGGAPRCSKADLAKSLLQMVTQQSVLLATAFAKHAGCVGRVFFVGGFVDASNHLAREAIAANFRSLGGCAYFLRHSDFLGALGSLAYALSSAETGDDSWSAGSQSPLGSSPLGSPRDGNEGLDAADGPGGAGDGAPPAAD